MCLPLGNQKKKIYSSITEGGMWLCELGQCACDWKVVGSNRLVSLQVLALRNVVHVALDKSCDKQVQQHIEIML